MVKAGLKEIKDLAADPVNQPVFLGDPPRPTAHEQVTERLGLAGALEWITHHRFDEMNAGKPTGVGRLADEFARKWGNIWFGMRGLRLGRRRMLGNAW
jgi:hypothetical protein